MKSDIWQWLRQVRAYRHTIKFGLVCWWHVKPMMRRQFHNLDVAIVGNSPQLVDQGLGPVIDSHGVVVRINLLDPSGREQDLGRRTDVRFVGATLLEEHSTFVRVFAAAEQLITTTKNEAFMGKFHLAAAYYPAILPTFVLKWLCASANIHKVVNASLPPRSGVVFLGLLLKYGRPGRITLYGFSNSQEIAGQVMNYAGAGITSYDREQYLRCHCDPSIEIDLLQQLAKAGRVVIRA